MPLIFRYSSNCRESCPEVKDSRGNTVSVSELQAITWRATLAEEATMKRYLLTAVLLAVVAGSVYPQAESSTVKGYVLDSACAFIKNLRKPMSRECALSCAKAGSPLVILADDGAIYWPISDAMPATGQNPRLMKFGGERVIVHGKVFERSGSRAMVIETIERAPDGK